MTDSFPTQGAASPSYVVAQPEQVALDIVGTTALFPVRRLFCVGRNYAEHAREMGHDPEREPPFFFMKPPEAVLVRSTELPYPPASSDVHHEVELVVGLKSGGFRIPVAEALDHVYGYAVGLDMTRRDLQGQAKKLQRPWEVGKAFDASAPIGPMTPAAQFADPSRGAITLDIDGERRQAGDLKDMIYSVAEVIAEISALFPLRAGDVIMTGTPSGVGPVKVGDRLAARIEGLQPLDMTVVEGLR